jgi:hypothetical protein
MPGGIAREDALAGVLRADLTRADQCSPASYTSKKYITITTMVRKHDEMNQQ